MTVRRDAEIGELHHHLCRKVVHNVVPAVLQTDGGAALSRTGHSRNNEYFQFSILHAAKQNAVCFCYTIFTVFLLSFLILFVLFYL